MIHRSSIIHDGSRDGTSRDGFSIPLIRFSQVLTYYSAVFSRHCHDTSIAWGSGGVYFHLFWVICQATTICHTLPRTIRCRITRCRRAAHTRVPSSFHHSSFLFSSTYTFYSLQFLRGDSVNATGRHWRGALVYGKLAAYCPGWDFVFEAPEGTNGKSRASVLSKSPCIEPAMIAVTVPWIGHLATSQMPRQSAAKRVLYIWIAAGKQRSPSSLFTILEHTHRKLPLNFYSAQPVNLGISCHWSLRKCCSTCWTMLERTTLKIFTALLPPGAGAKQWMPTVLSMGLANHGVITEIKN